MTNPLEEANRFAALADQIATAMEARGATTTGELFADRSDEKDSDNA